MGSFNRLIVMGMVLSAVACNVGGSGGSGNGEEENEEAVEVLEGGANGEYEGVGGFRADISVVNLNGGAPAEGECLGDVFVEIDVDGAVDIDGNGSCNLPANFIDYTFEGEFLDNENWEGEMVLVLNGQPHSLPVAGVFENGALKGDFAGRTPVSNLLAIDWNGDFSTDEDEVEEEEGDEEEDVIVAGGVANGEYEGADSVSINLILDDLDSNAAPSEADCFGDIRISIDDGAEVEIAGEGECSLPANFMTYSLEGELVDDDSWEGVISVVLNGRPYDFPVAGELDGDEIRGAFDGVNLVIGSIRGIWDGEFSAELVD